MSSVINDLANALRQADPQTAHLLECAVRDSLALAERRRPATNLDALGYPLGYFENTAGSFADEALDRQTDLPIQSRESW